MYVQGVSTRTVKAVTEALCGHTVSARTVSRIKKSLEGLLRRVAQRRLEKASPYVILEARYEKVRLDGGIQSPAVFRALGINAAGRRQVLGGGAVDPGVTIALDDGGDGFEDAGPARRGVRRLRRSRGNQTGRPGAAPSSGLATRLMEHT